MTVVFDAGQNSEANFAHLAATGLHYIGSVPASDCPDLTALPASARAVVDRERFGGLTAFDTRRGTYGAERRAVVTHSPELHDRPGPRLRRHHPGQGRPQARRAGRHLGPRQDPPQQGQGRGRDRRDHRQALGPPRHHLAAVREQPKDLRLAWGIDQDARAALEDELFGKHVLITSHDDWPVAEVVAGYRSQSEAEFSFRQLKDPHAVSFSPMFHWTEHNIRVHVFTCVLALQIAHLMRLTAHRAGLDLSVRALLGELAGIGETVLLYQAERGRPRAHRMLTDTTPVQDKLSDIFGLARYAPRR